MLNRCAHERGADCGAWLDRHMPHEVGPCRTSCADTSRRGCRSRGGTERCALARNERTDVQKNSTIVGRVESALWASGRYLDRMCRAHHGPVR